MEKNHKVNLILILIFIAIFSWGWKTKVLADSTLAEKLKGKILLQVEGHGEAWYVYPIDLNRYYLGQPKDAFNLMKDLGIGISNQDLAQIEIGNYNIAGEDTDKDGLINSLEDSLGTDINNPDSDGDGYGDKLEISTGHNPLGSSQLIFDKKIASRLSGLVVLQVQKNGEAWYINPDNQKRYYLGRPVDALTIMKNLGLGVSNRNLVRINQIEVKPEFVSENIKNNNTTLVTNSNLRNYHSNNDNYSFDYPADWRIRKFETAPKETQITDATRDFIIEKKGVIVINPFNTNEDYEVTTFRTIAKKDTKTVSDKKTTINKFDGYENALEYNQAFEKTTILKTGPKQFLRISLLTAKYNNDYYIKIYDGLLKSLNIK